MDETQNQNPQDLQVSIVEPTPTPTPEPQAQVVQSGQSVTVKIRDENDNLTDRAYIYKPWVPRWSTMLDWAAEIASGMVIETRKDENGDDISKLELTKEYSSKKNKVLTDIIRSTFNLDVNVDKIEPDSMFDLLKIVEDTGFLKRLERLNPSSSTTKKSSN